MNLLLVSDSDRLPDGLLSIRDHRAIHVATVLKASVGQTVSIGFVNGAIGEGEIVHCGSSLVLLKVIHLESPLPTGPEIELIVALPRPQTVRKLLIIAGMMRIRRVAFIRANRVEKSFFQSPLLLPEGMRPYLLEGLSQGKHTRLPQVEIHDRFRPFFEDTLAPRLESIELGKPCLKLIPTPEASQSLDRIEPIVNHTILAAIGPEGGWVPFEIDAFVQLGFCPLRLSRSILRVEHAAMALLAQLELVQNMSEQR